MDRVLCTQKTYISRLRETCLWTRGEMRLIIKPLYCGTLCFTDYDLYFLVAYLPRKNRGPLLKGILYFIDALT